MSYLDDQGSGEPAAGGFGFEVEEVAGGWRWRAFDPQGRLAEEGVAPTRALAAASLIRALSRT